MKYQKRLRATTLFLANRFMRYTLHCALSSGYLSFGTYRPTTWYCDWPVGKLAAFFPIASPTAEGTGEEVRVSRRTTGTRLWRQRSRGGHHGSADGSIAPSRARGVTEPQQKGPAAPPARHAATQAQAGPPGRWRRATQSSRIRKDTGTRALLYCEEEWRRGGLRGGVRVGVGPPQRATPRVAAPPPSPDAFRP